MLAKTLVVFYVWSPDIFVLIFIITPFQALFILLCQIKHYHPIPYHTICAILGQMLGPRERMPQHHYTVSTSTYDEAHPLLQASHHHRTIVGRHYKRVAQGSPHSGCLQIKKKTDSQQQGWGQVQYLYLVLVFKYIFIST